jgi:hypothetical protein
MARGDVVLATGSFGALGVELQWICRFLIAPNLVTCGAVRLTLSLSNDGEVGSRHTALEALHNTVHS